MQQIKVINEPTEQVERLIEKATMNAAKEILGPLTQLLQEMDKNPNFLRHERACVYLGGDEPLNPATLTKLRTEGKVKGVRRMRWWYYEKEELDRYLKEG